MADTTARLALIVGLTASSITFPQSTSAQSEPGAGGRSEIFAGSETENYLRYLQSMDTTNYFSWSLRPFSPTEIDRIVVSKSGNPWAARYDLAPRKGTRLQWGLIPPTISARFNSAFPYGWNDGPIWAGRGLTSAAQAGFFARFGPISLTLAPMLFRAENSSFLLEPSNRTCPPNCADALFPTVIDHPQRYGNKAYQRLDAGQSSLRVDGLGASVGFTTANEWWGPAQIYPFLLGNNAPGFPHLFLATDGSIPILIGRVSARVIYGRLDQSAYSPVHGPKYGTSDQPGRVRFASGLITVFEPRGLTGLEVGIGRFFHSTWPASGIPASFLRRPLHGPFSGLNESGNSTGYASNQLASGFARWVFPRAGLEIYGEYGEEDSHADFRGAIQEPDYTRAYSLGLRKIFRVRPATFSALHFELMNYQLPTLARFHGLEAVYLHNGLAQGHTNRGQLLGSPLGAGAAAGSTVQWDRYSAAGRTSLAWLRTVSQESGNFFQGGNVNSRSSDVSHALRVERVAFLHAIDLTSSMTVVRDFNRNFQADKWNLNGLVQLRFRLP